MLFKHTNDDAINLANQVNAHFAASCTAKQDTLENSTSEIIRAAQAIAGCLQKNGKILVCGNGGSAADAQHFASEMVGRLERDRPGLSAIALTTDTSAITAIANDYDFSNIFARQINTLGNSGDILLAISTSGNSANILQALKTAHGNRLTVIALSGSDGGKMATLLNPDDIEIRVCATRTMRIQETHILIIHCLCDLVDQLLFGQEI